MKICAKCRVTHESKSSWCNACRAAGMRAYRATPEGKAATRRMEAKRTVTPERIAQGKELRKRYAQTSKGRAVLRAASKRYNVIHKAERNAADKLRRQSDPLARTAANLRRRLRSVLGPKTSETSRTIMLLGCTLIEFRRIIAAQFVGGMTWANYGEWHLDHKIPLKYAKSKEELAQLSHHTNIQPMWAKYNRLKQDMLPHEWEAYVKRHQIDTAVP